ncbi:MAG TPA: RES domain-containing protein [Thermoanaerobaculia bacterium]|nr:RES domain-containing protein [Thermoanaerobaculia bacterium]
MSPSRTSPSLPAPPSGPGALSGFPRVTLGPEATLYRVARRGYGPWWFGNTGAGRFDLPAPEGTCYLAADPLAALLEILGPDRLGGAVADALFATRVLHELRLPAARSLADLISRRTAGWGLTHEIHTLVPYELPRAWAGALRAVGAEGVRYFLRHDPGAEVGYALFEAQGERTDWPLGRELVIDRALLDRLERETGIRTLPVPSSRELTFASFGSETA